MSYLMPIRIWDKLQKQKTLSNVCANGTFKKISLTCLLALGVNQAYADIKLTTHGRLSLGFFGNSNTIRNQAMFGLNAYVRANFQLNEHWNVGMGAAGIWNALSMIPGYSGYNNMSMATGDVGDIYFAYNRGGFKIVAGRYNVDIGPTIVRTTDFVNGPLQGISLQWIPKNSSPFRMWFSYINSFLDNGYLPGRIGSDLYMLNPYFYGGKIKLGGEVFLFGADFDKGIGKSGHRIFFAPWVLFNTKAPATNPSRGFVFDPLAQVGVKARFIYNINEAWQSLTGGNALFQYGNGVTSGTIADDLLGVFIIDEEIKYVRKRVNSNGKEYVDYSISAGLGFRGIFGNQASRFFCINDRTRFYGKFLNNAIYGIGGTWTAYAFAKMEHRIFDVHLMLGGGSYSEISLAGSWKAYRQNRNSGEGQTLGFDIGAGYSWAYSSVGAIGGGNNHGFMVFGKLFY
ncbi:hypothetical protein [Helicobacter didelphidarum]|uniref:hypothetical protein n=1 Tax=Helicobacter didelphidarum TaxID=2040648 RepID=UPI0015F172BC|nr:hypothetical protein [Helicobacter didelphidarum]